MAQTHHQECFPTLLLQICLYHLELVHGRILGIIKNDDKIRQGERRNMTVIKVEDKVRKL